MRIFISVVSHGHCELIKKLSCLFDLASHEKVYVILKNNLPSEYTDFFSSQGLHIIDKPYSLGFGANNNIVFQYCIDEFCISDEDFFLVLNPDVYITIESLINVVNMSAVSSSGLSSINLFKDFNFNIPDNSIRKFPNFTNFVFSYVNLPNKSIVDKSTIIDRTHVDWAAGSFLLFRASLFKKLSGFDEKYFMYCEDLDICFRANKYHSVNLLYFPDVKATHFAAHSNRVLFSKHFFWHIKSVFIYLYKYYSFKIKKLLKEVFHA